MFSMLPLRSRAQVSKVAMEGVPRSIDVHANAANILMRYIPVGRRVSDEMLSSYIYDALPVRVGKEYLRNPQSSATKRSRFYIEVYSSTYMV
jgi:hypothetical protein